MQHIHMTLDVLSSFFTNYASCEISNICSISATAMLIYTTWLVSSYTFFAYFSRTKHFNACQTRKQRRAISTAASQFKTAEIRFQPHRQRKSAVKKKEDEPRLISRKASLASASSVAAPRLIYHYTNHDTNVSLACLLACLHAASFPNMPTSGNNDAG
jgi:hypothetical protein